jgi:hypothetical protein
MSVTPFFLKCRHRNVNRSGYVTVTTLVTAAQLGLQPQGLLDFRTTSKATPYPGDFIPG